jgi:N-acetylmuramoyl-L-alanine amidase
MQAVQHAGRPSLFIRYKHINKERFMTTGKDLLALAETRLGEKYVNVLVPKDNPNWHGPWDCAEFASWVVYQTVGKLYGCTDNRGDPAVTEAYSGAWARDASAGTLGKTDRAAANVTPGVVLIRKPPMPGRMGHVALSDGRGGTVEAAGVGLGVRRARVEGRQWDYCALIPGVQYASTGANVRSRPSPFLLTAAPGAAPDPVIRRVQRALKAAGVDPGKIDGIYGPHTIVAVHAFQKLNRLVADGMVGPATAGKLGLAWP